jgi:hypothetical protein
MVALGEKQAKGESLILRRAEQRVLVKQVIKRALLEVRILGLAQFEARADVIRCL